MVIESVHNEHVKKARALSGKKGRISQGYYIIEGEKLVYEAVISGAVFGDVFIEEGHDSMQKALENTGANVFVVSRAVMESLTLTDTPQYVCAAVVTPKTLVPKVYPVGLIVVLDTVQDPGNLGTIVRTADAMGAAGVLLGTGCADPFAPKPVRAAMGSAFHISIWQGSLPEELDKLADQSFTLVCGHLRGESKLPLLNHSCAVIIGNESSGVSDAVADKCYKYRLPMYGRAESLNASVAAGIMIYEIAKEMQSR